MSYEADNAVSEQPAQRRPWDAPQIITVVPVDCTAGGFLTAASEGGPYTPS